MNPSLLGYRNGLLCLEAVPLIEIAQDSDAPLFCTSASLLRQGWKEFVSCAARAGAMPLRSLGDAPSLAALRLGIDAGVGCAVVSAGGIERALEAGCAPISMVLSGFGKTRDDLAAALLAGAGQVVGWSLAELALMDSLAATLGRRVPLVLGLDLAGTGRGFDLDTLATALGFVAEHARLSFSGLALRVGEKGETALRVLADLFPLLGAQGFAPPRVIAIEESACVWAQVAETLSSLKTDLSFLAAPARGEEATLFLAQVLGVLETKDGPCAMIEAPRGLEDLLDRTEVLPLLETSRATLRPTGFVRAGGEGRLLGGRWFNLPALRADDLLAFTRAGSLLGRAFDGVRAGAPEIMVEGAQYATVRRRMAATERQMWEALPEWMRSARAA